MKNKGRYCVIGVMSGTSLDGLDLALIEFVLDNKKWEYQLISTTTKSYTRADAMQFAPGFHKRAITMTTCEDFAPTPSKQACRWCSFKNATDDEPAACQWGVT